MNGLKAGDTIALLAPASAVKAEYCDGAEQWLSDRGFRVKRYASTRGSKSGTYSASEIQRVNEMLDALTDPEVKAILCARGGYGCIQLLPEIEEAYCSHPKLIIGFSDVSALHAMAVKHGLPSLHAPMAKHLSEHPDDEASRLWLETVTTLSQPIISYPTSAGSAEGEAEGILIGGNLAVLNSLSATPWDMLGLPLHRSCILMIEDISEAIYAVERMLYRLYYSGVLDNLSGLIIGQFTEYRPDGNYQTMEDMIRRRIAEWGISCLVAYGFPAGHTDDNRPLLLGRKCRLRVTRGQTTLESAE